MLSNVQAMLVAMFVIIFCILITLLFIIINRPRMQKRTIGKRVNIKDILLEVSAIIENDHVVYASGKHGRSYVNCDVLYSYPKKVEVVAVDIASHAKGLGVDVVLGPANGGIILAQHVAYNLPTKLRSEVRAAYADKSGDGFEIRRGYDSLIKDSEVLIVEDVVTTGGSVQKVIKAVREAGGNVVGVAVICNRGGITKDDLDVPFLYECIRINDMESWNSSECPLCTNGIKVNQQIGHGKKFVQNLKEVTTLAMSVLRT